MSTRTRRVRGGGPRVTAGAVHASALRDDDSDQLQEAARLYEAFGDRIPAADAAAQATQCCIAGTADAAPQ